MSVVAVHTLVLAWVRCFALLRVQPLLRAAVGPWWWAVAGAFAAVLAVGHLGEAPPPAPQGAVGWVVAVIAEALLGTILGLCVSLGGHAVVGGTTVPAVLLRVPVTPWLALGGAVVLLAALELGLHHAAFGAFGSLRQAFALGDAASWLGATPDAARLTAWLGGMTVLALAFATPSLLVAAAVELVAAAVARGPGSASALAQAVLPVLRLGAVLVALGASWAIDLPRWAQWSLPAADAGIDRLRP